MTAEENLKKIIANTGPASSEKWQKAREKKEGKQFSMFLLLAEDAFFNASGWVDQVT